MLGLMGGRRVNLLKHIIDMSVRAEIEELEEVALSVLAAGVSADQFRIDAYALPDGSRKFAIHYF